MENDEKNFTENFNLTLTKAGIRQSKEKCNLYNFRKELESDFKVC